MAIRKSIIGMLTGTLMMSLCVIPAFATSSKSTSVDGYTLYKYLNRGTSSATAITQYPYGSNSWISSIKYVTVTITCKNGSTNKTVTESATAVTNQAYDSKKATAVAKRPSTAYTITDAKSIHKLTMVGATKDSDVLTD